MKWVAAMRWPEVNGRWVSFVFCLEADRGWALRWKGTSCSLSQARMTRHRCGDRIRRLGPRGLRRLCRRGGGWWRR